jgi:shikimate kinase
MSKKDNVVLIGMPGSGKSTLGVVLAKKLGFDFMDGDIEIQNQYGKTLEELIDIHGDAGFIQIENDVLAGLDVKNTVIATGGSAVYGEGAMAHLAEIGTIVYLDVPEEELNGRLGNLKARGVVCNGKTTVKEIFEERLSLYRKYAEITVTLDHVELKDAVEEIYSIVYNN